MVFGDMQDLIELLKQLHSPDGLRHIVQAGGIVALTAIIFAETGLLAGFFLPGDSLLVTAGIFTSSNGMGGEGIFDLWTLLIVLTIAAVVGDQVGYILGRKTGSLIYQRKDSFFFKKKYLDDAKAFFDHHGPKALIFARFVPIFRTFVPFTAGMGQMDYKKFVRYNVIGGVLWIFSMILLGHYLGTTPLADQLHKVIVVVVFVSILPMLFTLAKRLLAFYKTKKKVEEA
jgi:membrane-associated protein